MILSLDPSSSVIGFAAFADSGSLVEGGLIEPEVRSAGSYWRIRSMAADLAAILDEFTPHVILIEWTKGKVGTRRHTGLGAGLAVYGAGIGSVANQCEAWAAGHQARVVPVLENTWTRGVPKASRQAAIAATIESYDASRDPGGDVADAIGMAQWWFKETLVRV